MKKIIFFISFTLSPFFLFSDDEDRGGIEEVIVTAERQASSIQDTALSITAFDDTLIEALNLRNQEDLQNYIPATTIQPYDISIRGIGRMFRALGGDPGVGTYVDGAYSVDFGIASTDNGLYDLERIEILRGPQGTLYGRNSIGGAVNFITAKPSQDFAAEVRTLTGSYGLAEAYGFINGAITENLSARIIATNRSRDGVIKDLGGYEDLDSYEDENYTLALRWENDNHTFDIRGNERSYGRVLSSAQGAGLLTTSEYGGNVRRNDLMVHGYRPVDPSVQCSSLADRTVANCSTPGFQIFEFNHKGLQRFGQFLVPGVDPAITAGTGVSPNYAFGYDKNILAATMIGDGKSVPSMTGDDLVTSTNGYNDEYFDHQAGTINYIWDVQDNLTIKYIGSYTDYLYTRITDDDRTGNPAIDEQFHAMQENENYQHEIQFFWDITDDWNFVGGLFEYHEEIDQDLDFFNPAGDSRYSQAANYGSSVTASASRNAQMLEAIAVYGAENPSLPFFPTTAGPYTARDVGCGIASLLNAAPVPNFADPSLTQVCILSGPWDGESAVLRNGPNPSPGTTFVWQTENKTDAYAAYFQTEYQINDTWAITVGGSYSEDEKVAEENLVQYAEMILSSANLLAFNVSTGALNADGTPTGEGIIRFQGIPYSRSFYRSMEREFEESNYRVNVDYSPTDNALWYLSVTTGHRAGGFNLGFFSAFPSYDSENVTSYELGHKGSYMDNTLQINASTYQYVYENIHGQFESQSFLGGVSTSVLGYPEAETKGFELEVIYMPEPNWIIGGNYSYTDARYSKEIVDPFGNRGVIEVNNPNAPESLYTIKERERTIDGVKMERIPENKISIYSNYTQEVNGGTIDYLVGASWTDEIIWSDAALPLDISPAFSRVDMKATWTNNEGDLELMFFVN
ncbi:TonB-dependent receptor, partial [Gammaproteobacteria bacterium]|nr:TonB-dependent receptor [Gammaproteobacteria bacterium]